MGKLNWSRVKTRDSLRRNDQLAFEFLLKKKQSRAVTKPVVVPAYISAKRKDPPKNMRPCANVFCTTFLNKSSSHIFCSFHGRR